MGRIRYAACLAVVLAGGITVAGCGGDQSAGSPSPTSSAASPSVSATKPPASPSVSPSASPSYSVPAAARVQSEAGAIAFVKFYFDQVNKAWMVPDDTLVPPLSKPSCKSCAGLQADAVELKAKGQRMTPAPGRLSDVRTAPGAPAGQAFVSITLHQTGAKVLDAEGRVVDRDKVFVRSYIAALTWEDSRWLMLGIASV